MKNTAYIVANVLHTLLWSVIALIVAGYALMVLLIEFKIMGGWLVKVLEGEV